jgi:alkyl hydroperoxide reductase subunit AhpC
LKQYSDHTDTSWGARLMEVMRMSFDSFDFLRHMILSMHPLGFFFMCIKEAIDVNNNYVELYDWVANFIGVGYYFLFSTLFKNILKKEKRFNLELN